MILHDECSKVSSGALSGLTGGSVIGAPPIVRYGTPEQKQKWLPGIFTGETRFCLAATEPTGESHRVILDMASLLTQSFLGGSDLANLRTTARKTECGRYYVVNGHKVSKVNVTLLPELLVINIEMDNWSPNFDTHDHGCENRWTRRCRRVCPGHSDQPSWILGKKDRKQRSQCWW